MCDLILLDLFIPLKCVMEALQGVNVAPWKCIKYVDSLIAFYSKMDFHKLESCEKLAAHFQEVSEGKFKGKFCLVFVLNLLEYFILFKIKF